MMDQEKIDKLARLFLSCEDLNEKEIMVALRGFGYDSLLTQHASIAQAVEHPPCKRTVPGSRPGAGFGKSCT